MDGALGVALDLGQFAVLCGIFLRLGTLSEKVRAFDGRLAKLEGATL